MAEPEGEDGRTDSDDQDDQERPPGSRGNGKGTDAPGGSSRTPAEEFGIQKSKTIKTAEALPAGKGRDE